MCGEERFPGRFLDQKRGERELWRPLTCRSISQGGVVSGSVKKYSHSVLFAARIRSVLSGVVVVSFWTLRVDRGQLLVNYERSELLLPVPA